jgi:hypothetical protein
VARYRDGGPLIPRLSGRLAWWLWGIAHVYFLIGFRNRIAVAVNWAWNYATFQGGTRLITGADPNEAPPLRTEAAAEATPVVRGVPAKEGKGSSALTAT